MARKLRIREYRFQNTFEGYQLVQEKKWFFFWWTIDKIEIPSHVIISKACFGDTGGWISPVVEKYGKWDKKGNIKC